MCNDSKCRRRCDKLHRLSLAQQQWQCHSRLSLTHTNTDRIQGLSRRRNFLSIRQNTDSRRTFLEGVFITYSLYANACGAISSLTSSPYYDTAEGPTPRISHYNVCLDWHVLLITVCTWQRVRILSSSFICIQKAESLNSSCLRGLPYEAYANGHSLCHFQPLKYFHIQGFVIHSCYITSNWTGSVCSHSPRMRAKHFCN